MQDKRIKRDQIAMLTTLNQFADEYLANEINRCKIVGNYQSQADPKYKELFSRASDKQARALVGLEQLYMS